MTVTRFAAEAGDFRPIAASDLPPGFLAGTGLKTVLYSSPTVNATWGEFEQLNPGVTTVNVGSPAANPGAMLGLFNSTGANVTVTLTSGSFWWFYNTSSITIQPDQTLLLFSNGLGAFFVLAATAVPPSNFAQNGPASGTYTTPPGALYLIVELVGGGGGGAGSGTGATSGGNGGTSTFGSLTANGGAGGAPISIGGSGGTVGGANILNVVGGQGGGSELSTVAAQNAPGGHGGVSFYGGGAGTTASGNPGLAGQAPGSGGGGGAEATSTSWSAAGGGAGGYVKSFITSPNASYAWAAGGGGDGGGAGTGGLAGGAGQFGMVRVFAYFQ